MEQTNSYTEGLNSLIKAIKAQIKAPNRRSRFTITRDQKFYQGLNQHLFSLESTYLEGTKSKMHRKTTELPPINKISRKNKACSTARTERPRNAQCDIRAWTIQKTQSSAI